MSNGKLIISEEVLEFIVAKVASEIEGVDCIGYSIVDAIKDSFSASDITRKGVDVKYENESNVIVNVQIKIKYGINIPRKAAELQEAIKRNLEAMTNLNVIAVNIYVRKLEL